MTLTLDVPYSKLSASSCFKAAFSADVADTLGLSSAAAVNVTSVSKSPNSGVGNGRSDVAYSVTGRFSAADEVSHLVASRKLTRAHECLNGAVVSISDEGSGNITDKTPNACLIDNGGCDSKADCSFVDKVPQCKCPKGYTGDGKQCALVCNKCTAAQEKTCSAHAKCCAKLGVGNHLTEHTCSCNEGWNGPGSNGIKCFKSGSKLAVPESTEAADSMTSGVDDADEVLSSLSGSGSDDNDNSDTADSDNSAQSSPNKLVLSSEDTSEATHIAP